MIIIWIYQHQRDHHEGGNLNLNLGLSMINFLSQQTIWVTVQTNSITAGIPTIQAAFIECWFLKCLASVSVSVSVSDSQWLRKVFHNRLLYIMLILMVMENLLQPLANRNRNRNWYRFGAYFYTHRMTKYHSEVPNSKNFGEKTESLLTDSPSHQRLGCESF